MSKPIRDRHGIEPENAEDRAVLAAASARAGMAQRVEAGASVAVHVNQPDTQKITARSSIGE